MVLAVTRSRDVDNGCAQPIQRGMGWQERDWAKLTDSELEALYGVVRPAATNVLRVRIWSGLAVLVFAVGGFAYTQRPAPTWAPQQATQVIGIQGTNRNIPADYPGGTNTACTEEAYTAAEHRWACLSWAVDSRQLPIVKPAPYVGACTHLVADRNQARWTCLGGGPVSPGEVPPPDAPMPGLST